MRKRIPLGPAVIDPVGLELSEEDRVRLLHPAVGGVILFAHNFADPGQLRSLSEEIHALREPALLICADHEGGRVQRFRDGFTAIPPMRKLGECWDRDRDQACVAARAIGLIVAAELVAHGVDFSFTPVLDLDYGASSVIGDRALHFDPIAVGILASQLVEGLAQAGMGAVGKHFPGHGFAALDSHVSVPRDERPLSDITRKDLEPYRATIRSGLAAIMPAHVIFPAVDTEPAGYSRYWLRQVLREELGFDGLVFSDDLSMEGASTAGGIPERAEAALQAGCDMVLLCQNPEEQDRLLAALGERVLDYPERADRLRARGGRDMRKSVAYREALSALAALLEPS